MKVKELGTSKSNTRLPPLFNGLPEEVPFKKGYILMVDTINNPNYVLGKENLVGLPLIVDECYRSDIGKMSVWIVTFSKQDGLKIENPYLAHHFVAYED